MPRRTLWIRNDDAETFDNIPDRPDWLHAQLVVYLSGKIILPPAKPLEITHKLINKTEIVPKMPAIKRIPEIDTVDDDYYLDPDSIP